jgi:hypothetical protein
VGYVPDVSVQIMPFCACHLSILFLRGLILTPKWSG